MAWTAPMTAVDGAIFTAAQFNASIRDNFLETAPAKATAANGYFVATGANSIAQRFPASLAVNLLETTASATYGDLATFGPSVTVTTGTKALVIITAQVDNDTVGGTSLATVLVSGASSVPVSDDNSIGFEQDGAAGQLVITSRASMYTCI